ncbi:MAG: aminotransferase class I/II-fold pyridoxal phosphate-dependent enzyme [Hyphomicrobiaceae bacterium]|nr:aminotransferase class I/II-fold pyridoxal phosphate-dependent enzyme [Hyphomicrobiaceae bacterium]
MTAPRLPSTADPADLVYRAGSPFVRLAALLDGVRPAKDPLVMAVGEPKHPQPEFVAPVLNEALSGFSNYPAITGSETFRKAVADWATRRYALATPLDPLKNVLTANGSREALAFAAVAAVERARARLGRKRPALLLPNPFYQGYVGGALMAGADAFFQDGAFPDPLALDAETRDRLAAIYVASPANPQGTVMDRDGWLRLIDFARDHDVMLFADECYSELYGQTPPTGLLEAADESGHFDGLVSFNSLSKRSNLPGLRVGFMIGDADFLALSARLRNMAAPQVPLPLQAVAAAVLADEAHVADNRRRYEEKWTMADAILAPVAGYCRAEAGFFLWLEIGGDDAAFVRDLYAEEGLRILPGSYCAVPLAHLPAERQPGAGHIRIALVESPDITREGLTRLLAALRRHRPALFAAPSSDRTS